MTKMRALLIGIIPTLALLLMAQTSPPSLRLANPSGTIGLAAVNGTATTALRSDGHAALSQAIAPTWTGAHVFDAGLTIDDGGRLETACSITVADGAVNDLDVFAGCTTAGAHAIVRMSSAAGSTIQGIVLPNNQYVTVINVGTTNIVFNEQNAGSAASNRIIPAGGFTNCTLNADDGTVLWKDPTTDRVRMLAFDTTVCGA